MEELPPDTEVLLRAGNKTQPGMFERVMAMGCEQWWWLKVTWVRPDPDGGREATFNRDVAYARMADLVLAFFDTDEMTGGTGHVVEKAMDVNTPVYAFGNRGGKIVRIGEHDPDEVFAERVAQIGV
jgi:hypothetical protein